MYKLPSTVTSKLKMANNTQQQKMGEICDDNNTNKIESGSAISSQRSADGSQGSADDSKGISQDENNGTINHISDMDVCQNEAEILEETTNTNSGRKHKRRHRNRSEKQKERVRTYKKKKREEKVKIEFEKLTEKVQTECPDITRAPQYITGAEAWSYKNISSDPRTEYHGKAVLPGVYEGKYWSDIGMRCLENISVAVGGMVPVSGDWYAGNVYTNTTDMHVRNAQNWQQKELSNLIIQADAFVPPSNTAVSSETAMPTVCTQSEIVSALRASAEVFVPGTLKPTNLSKQAEIVSNLRVAAEPFVPKVGQEPTVSYPAETTVPTKSTSCIKSEEPDATARFCEDICELNAAKPLKAHAFTTASADSNMAAEKVSIDSVAPTDSNVQFEKVLIDITAPVDSNVQSEKTATDIAAHTDSGKKSGEVPADTTEHVESNMPSQKAHVDIVPSEKTPVESVVSVISNVPYEKTLTYIITPVDSNKSSAKTPVDMKSRVDSKVPSEKTHDETVAPVGSNMLSWNTDRESASTSMASPDVARSEYPVRTPMAIFVPLGENSPDVSAPPNVQRDDVMVSQIIFDNTAEDADNMFGILAIYVESGLHCGVDEIVRNSKEITEEDFGYTHFSLSNLLK